MIQNPQLPGPHPRRLRLGDRAACAVHHGRPTSAQVARADLHRRRKLAGAIGIVHLVEPPRQQGTALSETRVRKAYCVLV
jgi:hypothetical protein